MISCDIYEIRRFVNSSRGTQRQAEGLDAGVHGGRKRQILVFYYPNKM